MTESQVHMECERLKRDIELAEAESNFEKAYKLRKELEFLMRHFPDDCDGTMEPIIDSETPEGHS